jgi:hypothetical protein
MIYIKIQFDSQFKKWSSDSQFESRFDNNVKEKFNDWYTLFCRHMVGHT